MDLRKLAVKLRPSAEERKEERRILKKIEGEVKTFDPKLEVMLVGSTAKDTDLRGDKDMDVFILFPEDTSREELEVKGLDIGKSIGAKFGEYIIKYAEHPYVNCRIDGYDVDVVPCYKLKNAHKIKSAVDRTPFHTEFVLGRTTQKTCADIRLLKRFCKGVGVYGSSLKIEGFAGYLCELLVIYYGSFGKVIENAGRWKLPVVLDINGKAKTKKTIEKFGKEFVFIDPVDGNRNVAAVVSDERLNKFMESCREFTKSPSEEFFYPKEEKIDMGELKKALKKKTTKTIRFQIPDIIEDILWPQLRKSLKEIANFMKRNDMEPARAYVYSDDKSYALFLLEFDNEFPLPKTMLHHGPKAELAKACENFREYWSGSKSLVKGPFEMGGLLCVELKRTFRDFESLFRHMKDKEVLEEMGFGSKLYGKFLESAKVMSEEELYRMMKGNKELARELQKFLLG